MTPAHRELLELIDEHRPVIRPGKVISLFKNPFEVACRGASCEFRTTLPDRPQAIAAHDLHLAAVIDDWASRTRDLYDKY